MRLGIVGNGIIGSALVRWFKKNTKHEIAIYDSHTTDKDNLDGCEAVFICVPAPTRKDGTQNLAHVEEAIKRCPKKSIIFVRSTILPGTCDALSTKEKRVYAMPEFLTARNADHDMYAIPIIAGENGSKLNIKTVLHDIFPNKCITVMSNTEAAIVKYLHNVLAFTKVWVCNAAYMMCKVMGANYETVRSSLGISGLINGHHTSVPGPDGKVGVGGKCLPKDLLAFATHLETLGIGEGKILKLMYKHNEKYRLGEKFTE